MNEKRNDWFTDYQEIPGIQDGKRKLKDRCGFNPSDFQDKSVLDLGCNIGQMSFLAAECGAIEVLGVEYDEDAFAKAREIRGSQRRSVIEFKLDDLDNPLFWNHIEPFDTVLLLSVIDTKELDNRFGILSKACMKCKGVLYFEGHENQQASKYFKYLLDYTDFTQIEHVGCYAGRDLFRCSREVLDSDGFYRKLYEACDFLYYRVGVVGNQMAGKSTLRRGLDHSDSFTILDDCDDLDMISSTNRLLLFDYRAALYASDLDVLFHVLQPPEKFESRRPNAKFLRSSQIAPTLTLRCLYTVRTH